MQLRRLLLVALATAGLGVAAASPAMAADEARFEQVGCAGFRVVQHGLPANTTFHISVFDPRTLAPVAAADVRTDATGSINRAFTASLAGHRQLMADVEIGRDGGNEWGEADLDLHLNCPAAAGLGAPGNPAANVGTVSATTPVARAGSVLTSATASVWTWFALAIAAVASVSMYVLRRRVITRR